MAMSDGVWKSTVAMVVALGFVSSCADCWKPTLHRVGEGRQGWRPDVNFTNWSIHQTFYVGDWLYFGFDKKRYNVLQVNETSYEHCVERDFIANVTRGGRDVFNLTDVKPFFFICGRGGHCFHGMKLAVHVVNIPPPSPPPPPSISSIKNINAASPPENFPGGVVALLPILVLVVCFSSDLLGENS